MTLNRQTTNTVAKGTFFAAGQIYTLDQAADTNRNGDQEVAETSSEHLTFFNSKAPDGADAIKIKGEFVYPDHQCPDGCNYSGWGDIALDRI